MSSIDEVISRSRQSGSMGEHKTFSIARNRAIEKMRNFALADPHFFALELIQGAVANGATYVDIASEKKFFALSYIGGGFAEEDLSQLFDFLFASKADLEQSAMRQMALGINALMLMKPDQITMVSGDGTLEGTCQITIKGERVMVGTPDQPLSGTFINAQGLKRRLVASKSNLSGSLGGGPECTVIEDRCLAAPVPMLVNNDPIFGYASMKHPVLYGYNRVISFDEGDLYGSIGISYKGAPRHQFKLLTYGVWAQTVSHELVTGQSIGGIITFDRLNKTADHAAIVHDDRIREMWARVMPYVQKLMQGESGKLTYTFETLGGRKVDVSEARELLDSHRFVLCVAPETKSRGPSAYRAIELSEALNDAPILRVESSMVETLKHMAGKKTTVLQPNLSDNKDFEFYLQAPVEPPAQPWLLDKMVLGGFSIRDVVDWISADVHQSMIELKGLSPADVSLARVDDKVTWCGKLGLKVSPLDYELRPKAKSQKAQARESFDEFDATSQAEAAPREVNLTLYVPKWSPAAVNGVHVRVVAMERLIWEGLIDSAYSGFVLDIELVDVVPGDVLYRLKRTEKFDADLTLAQAVAMVCVQRLNDQFERANHLVFESLRADDVEPKSISARRVLSSIARDSILRLRKLDEQDEMLSLTITMLTKTRLDLLTVPVLRTLSGESISIQQLVEMMREQHGLIYGTIPEIEVALDGLDLSRVLDLSVWEEHALLAIFGESAYVRIDVRNFLASVINPLTHVRDVALGLRSYDTRLPLLIEHGDIDALIENGEHIQVCEQLVNQLRALAIGDLSVLEATLASQVEDIQNGHFTLEELCEENRRQAVRHLQWFLAHHDLLPEVRTFGVERLPLFLDHAGHTRSWLSLLNTQGSLTMLDGRSRDARCLTALGDRESMSGDASVRDHALMMNAYVYSILKDKFSMESAFDFDFSSDEALKVELTPDEAFLVGKQRTLDLVDAHIGVAAAPRESFSFACVWPNGDVRAMTGLAENFGLVGTLRVHPGYLGDVREDHQLLGLCRSVLSELIDVLPEWSHGSPEWEVGAQTLLRYARAHIQLVEQPDGLVRLSHQDAPLVHRILNLPLFDTIKGMPIGASRLVRIFCLTHHTTRRAWRDVLVPDLHPILSRWVDEVLHPQRIVKMPSSHHRPTAATATSPTFRDEYAVSAMNVEDQRFGQLIHDWLEKLRPDSTPLDRVFVLYPSALESSEQARHWGEYKKNEEPSMRYIIADGFHRLLLNGEHPFVINHRARAHQSQSLSWLLLACYACINEVYEDVTNDHELLFQRRLIETLL